MAAILKKSALTALSSTGIFAGNLISIDLWLRFPKIVVSKNPPGGAGFRLLAHRLCGKCKIKSRTENKLQSLVFHELYILKFLMGYKAHKIYNLVLLTKQVKSKYRFRLNAKITKKCVFSSSQVCSRELMVHTLSPSKTW